MLFVIHALDRPDAADLRAAHTDRHRAYLGDAASLGIQIVFSGPLVSDQQEQPIGSLLVVDASDRWAAEAFAQCDPLSIADVYAQVSTTAFKKVRG